MPSRARSRSIWGEALFWEGNDWQWNGGKKAHDKKYSPALYSPANMISEPVKDRSVFTDDFFGVVVDGPQADEPGGVAGVVAAQDQPLRRGQGVGAFADFLAVVDAVDLNPRRPDVFDANGAGFAQLQLATFVDSDAGGLIGDLKVVLPLNGPVQFAGQFRIGGFVFDCLRTVIGAANQPGLQLEVGGRAGPWRQRPCQPEVK